MRSSGLPAPIQSRSAASDATATLGAAAPFDAKPSDATTVTIELLGRYAGTEPTENPEHTTSAETSNATDCIAFSRPSTLSPTQERFSSTLATPNFGGISIWANKSIKLHDGVFG
jgi:hypothetical protein